MSILSIVYLEMSLSVVSFVAAMAAAYYWWQSSKVSVPEVLRGTVPYGGMATINTNPLVEAAKKSARLNTIAAGFSAVSAFCAGLVTLFGFVPK